MTTLTDEEFRRILEKCSDEDFDGHTEFANLTPEQRLNWLSQLVQFYVESAGIAQAVKCSQDSLSSGEDGVQR